MNFKIALISIIISFSFQQDTPIAGIYTNNFGDKFIFNSDLTYEFESVDHLLFFWSKGKWKEENDTIFFTAIPVYDTLRIPKKEDTLILSKTKMPRLIHASNKNEIIEKINLGPQDPYGGKLFFKNNKLYEIDKNGKLIIEKKSRSFTRKNSKKFDPWYTKASN